jgi:hypothetical protein
MARQTKYNPEYCDKVIKWIEKGHSKLFVGLIHEITVSSRPRNEKDIIAGRKKDDQFIPERIDIVLNLPQQLFQEVYTKQFVARTDKV